MYVKTITIVSQGNQGQGKEILQLKKIDSWCLAFNQKFTGYELHNIDANERRENFSGYI